MRMYDLIMKKRDGKELTKEEIKYFVQGYTNGDIPEYQASAFLMTIFLNKMNKRETVDLTHAMMHSGDVIDLSAIEGIKVDKHSTGGVGDTTTLVLAPLVAACGIPVAKMSGRGLGHTGGTIDKLESIEGFHTEITMDEFIASSIMSKKLAAGSDAIVLDVKVGSGAFIKDIDGALELAGEMVDIGADMNRNTIAVITDMEQPLGLAIGNALEVKEAIDTLHGKGPEDLTELCVKLGSYMVLLGGGADTYESARDIINENLSNGKAFEKFKEFLVAQGGNVDVIDNPEKLPQASILHEVKAPQDGFVEHIKSDEVGIAAMMLGAGRESLDSVIDLASGIMLTKKVGAPIAKGETIAVFHTNKESAISGAEKRFLDAYTFTTENVEKSPLIKAVVKKDGVEKFI